MTSSTAGPRPVSLEIRGFRAFGTEARTLQLDAPLRRDTLAGVNPYWRIGWSIGLRGSAHMRR